MKSPKNTLEELIALQNKLLADNLPISIKEQIKAIQVTIDLIRAKSHANTTSYLASRAESIQEGVINAVLELIEKTGHKVSSKQILDYFTEKGIFVDRWKDKNTALGSILYGESQKTNGKIRKVKRGVWDKRPEKVAQSRESIDSMHPE